jgi:hypothetical protein
VDIGKVASPTRGRGDPASTMLCSPMKHAGQKRPLKPAEVEDSDDEEVEAEVEVVRLVGNEGD